MQHNLNIQPKQVLPWVTIPSTSNYPCFCDSAPASQPTLIAQFMLIGLQKFQAYSICSLNSKEVQKHTYVLVRKAAWVFYYTGCKCNKNASFCSYYPKDNSTAVYGKVLHVAPLPGSKDGIS